MESIQPIKKAVVGGATGGVSVMAVIMVLINIISRNYGIEIDQSEAVLLAGAVSVLWGFAQGWIVWRVPNVAKTIDERGARLANPNDMDVMPIDDIKEHIQGAGCHCKPKTIVEGDTLIIVHNAYDGREIIENVAECLGSKKATH